MQEVYWLWVISLLITLALSFSLVFGILTSQYYLLPKVILFSCSTFLLILLALTLSHSEWVNQWNVNIDCAMNSLRNPRLDKWMVSLTLLAHTKVIGGAVGLCITGWLLINRYYWAAISWIILAGVTVVIGQCLKLGISYARPVGISLPSLSSAFPSGHTLINTTFLGALLILIYQNKSLNKNAWIVYNLFGTWISLVAFSRLYLGAHWLSDLLGGLLLGISSISLFALCPLECPLGKSRGTSLKSLIQMIALAMSFGWGINMLFHYSSTLQAHTPLTYTSITLNST